MKMAQILYLVLIVGIMVCIIRSTHLLNEGFQSNLVETLMATQNKSELVIPANLDRWEFKMPVGLKRVDLDTAGVPSPYQPVSIPSGVYGQMASVGSYMSTDPKEAPANLQQIKQLSTDLNTFLEFESANISDVSDPEMSLKFTRLRADNEALKEEISSLENNPNSKSKITQDELTTIRVSLTYFQGNARKVDGFLNYNSKDKKKASLEDLQNLQMKLISAILTLSSSGTKDPVIQKRILNLQNMQVAVADRIKKLQNGVWTKADIDVYSNDINEIIPILANTKRNIKDIMNKQSAGSGKNLSPVEKQIAMLVGEDNAKGVFKNIQDKGSFRVTVDMGYNIPGMNNGNSKINIKKNIGMYKNMDEDSDDMITAPSISIDGPYDTNMSGMDDREYAAYKKDQAAKAGKDNKPKQMSPSHLDWAARAKGVYEQIKRRGLDPLDFGCVPEGSKLSPAYSWRGHMKMVCGRLASTMDPGLPEMCGCPPPNWKGWTLPNCLSPPPLVGLSKVKPNCLV